MTPPPNSIEPSGPPDAAIVLTSGDAGPGVQDLHQRLFRAGMLDALPDPIDSFTDKTVQAVETFQQRRGLRPDGICDQSTWDALVEANFQLGDRLLYLQKPMTRGDDVEECQRRLGMMGFNAGRVDGIFGPDTLAALEDFQRNAGLTVDGICGHETLAAMRRIRSHVGDQTVAAVREAERLRTTLYSPDSARLVIGDLGGQRALADLTARLLRQRGATVAFIEQPTESNHARAANEFEADLYVGIGLADEPKCNIRYFSVPNYVSTGGQQLAGLLVDQLDPVATQVFSDGTLFANPGRSIDVDQAALLGTPQAEGLRQPVLRETRMPAVVLEIGPSSAVVINRPSWAEAIADGVIRWLDQPIDLQVHQEPAKEKL